MRQLEGALDDAEAAYADAARARADLPGLAHNIALLGRERQRHVDRGGALRRDDTSQETDPMMRDPAFDNSSPKAPRALRAAVGVLGHGARAGPVRAAAPAAAARPPPRPPGIWS